MKHTTCTLRQFRRQALALEISRAFGATAMLAAMPLAFAAPQGGTVTAGQASIQNNGALTTITQGSQRAAIDWRSFNVSANETVNFVQPNASAAILNRVVGNDPSAIFGRITANGQVLLINPNGILFGRTAQVDVGALTATTSNLSNADFMAGRLNFTEPGRPGATVENQGRITVAEGGFAALVGRQVANSGVITARLGKVALAGGDAFVLDLYGDKLVNLVVDPAAMGALLDAQGQPLAARVDHAGEIVADGGRVQLSVATVKQLVDNLINLSGVVRATSFTQAQGVISLHGDANTRVNVSGTLDTSGEQRGGRIEVTGRDVELQPGARLAATGGHGSIAVGGEWQGQGSLAHAAQVNVAQGASLDASGGTQGPGGTAVLWSDRRTQFAGRIAASGGTVSGDAGQVEVSSKGQLAFQGDVDVFAANGRQGSLLLDPANLTIAATTVGDSQISADQLRYFLTRGTNVTLSADQNVTVDAEINGLVTGGGGTAGGGLTLTAGNNLSVNQSIVLNNGALNLTATNGTLTQANGTVLYTGTGAANLRGGAGVDLGQVASGGAVDIRSANGAVTVRNAIVAATGNGAAAPVASLNVDGAGVVSLNGALVQGNATIRSRNAGVGLATAVVQSQAGNVQVDAATTITSAASSTGLVSTVGTATANAGQDIDIGVVLATQAASLTSTNAGVTVRQTVAGTSGAVQSFSVNAAGAVALAGANAGSGGISIATSSGNITSQGANANEGGLVATGNVSLTASNGRVGTSVAPIRVQSGGNVVLSGSAGVSAATVLGAGTVNLTSAAGSVAVSQAIAAQAGAVTASTTARPTGVTVTGRDGVDIAGAVAGTSGVQLTSSAGGVTVRNSLFSAGPVNATAQGAIALSDGAGISTTDTGTQGAVSLQSTGGTVTLGNGGIRAGGAGAGVALSGRDGVAVNGDIQANGGTISLASSQGAVRVLASATGSDAALNATLDAGTSAANSVISVTAAGDVEVGEMIAYNSISLTSTAGDVTLQRGLGGNTLGTVNGVSGAQLNTGYVDYASGYQVQYRPNVGRLVIAANAGSVELNGLNLDGNANASDTSAGLSVTAGRRIISNNEIAVNKGDIVLAGGTTQATDGVYLGSSVYSRGYDSVGANGVRGGGDDQKIGYSITVTGNVLGLFDNTLEMARLPVQTYRLAWYEAGPGTPPPLHDVRTDALGFVVDTTGIRLRNSDGSFQQVGYLTGSIDPSDLQVPASSLGIYNVNASGVVVAGQASAGTQVIGVAGVAYPAFTQEIAKIEVANNTANYQDAANLGTLVAPTGGTAASRLVRVGTGTIAGVSNHAEQTPMRLTDPLPTLVAPSQTPIQSAPADAGAVGASRGIGLKLLGFAETGDQSSVVWSSRVQAIDLFGPPFVTAFDENGQQLTPPSQSSLGLSSSVPVNGQFTLTVPALASRTYTDSNGNSGVQTVVVPTGGRQALITFQANDTTMQRATVIAVSVTGTNDAVLANVPDPSNGGTVGSWTFSAWRTVGEQANIRLVTPALSVAGASAGVVNTASIYPSTSGAAPAFTLLAPNYAQRNPFQEVERADQSVAPRAYTVTQSLFDVQSTGTRPGTRVFVYDGVINGAGGAFAFDSNTGVAIPGASGIPGFNNSTVGFAGVGAGFGSLGNGTAGSTGVGSTSGQSVGGATIPGGLTGTGTPPPAPVVEDRSTQDVANTTAPSPDTTGRPGGTDLAFSVGPAAEADLGRGTSVPGSAVNVFKRLYRLATSSSPGVCAPGVVQQTSSAEGGASRDCAAK